MYSTMKIKIHLNMKASSRIISSKKWEKMKGSERHPGKIKFMKIKKLFDKFLREI